MSFSVYLVRHGQTYLNLYNRMQGWCDSPLTQKGVADAHLAGKRLANKHFDYAFHSDTMRTKRTCEYLLAENQATDASLKPKELRNFREQSFGYFEGSDASQAWTMIGAKHNCHSFKDVVNNYSLVETRDFMKEADPFDDAENDAEFWSRVKIGFDYLRDKIPDGKNVLVVSHAMTIRSIANLFDEKTPLFPDPANGSVTKLTVDGHNFTVDYYNQTGEDFDY
ncbi:histidine phosphatase family protein [Ligilactobacillus acidipiscis]|jgi:Fructose-2,6-bisphosphatase|uniref:Histidine phosphatase family protein n=2 Tax=Ligilactobacillus acidipiscis TaxID=89059 RepID=A0A1K1KQX0_9LACO|nr:histidine phosphatase family protein [Ligilactobacillus acidipiscis]MCI1924124.1 histidine phosphatase family protein [Ligilactobacillus acidipiscis]WEV56449.1 histidine phosphatase family protein [Ligilactobacillus acidipiscis]SFV41232.1 Phosphoglycerate mutase family [Ligilactobacillus acidipiscis]GAW64504.1 phosphoglycerate mutase [Ligilactobacillus acidipiscis]GEN20509.1 phosphoglycerate mutase [Ligilactobacillus acidipiscis]